MTEIPAKRYKLLNAFRGLAILWIVCFHVLVNVREQYGIVLNYIIAQGYLGVSIFIVISGYGVASSISHGTYWRNPLSFLWRRLKRIYFPYWWHLLFAALIIPVLSALVSTIKSHPFDFSLVNYSILDWLKIITLAKVFSAVNWKLNVAFLPLNGVVWFIAIIVQIYLFVSICLIFGKKYYSFFLFVGFIGSLLTNFPTIKETLPYGIFLPYFSMFYIGFFLYFLLRKDLVPKTKLSKILIMLICMGAVCYCALNDKQLLSLSFAVLTGSAFLVMYEYDFKLSQYFLVRLFYVVGTFSYSLYLLHAPLWPFVNMFVRNLVPLSSSLTGPFVLVPGIIVLSFIWYLFFEKPSTQQEIANSISTPINTIRSGVNYSMKFLFDR